MLKKIVALISALLMFLSAGACSKEPEKDNTGTPKITVDGDASATFENGILKVKHSSNVYIADVIIDGKRVWLCDGCYTLEQYDSRTKIEIKAVPISERNSNQQLDSIVLSLYDTSNNAYSVTWHTAKADCPTMKIRLANSDETHTINAYSDEGNGDFVNRAVAYNLEYGKEYTYTLCDAQGKERYTASFTTPEKEKNEITFMHVTDTQDEANNGAVWAKLMENVYQNTPKLDLIIHTGDMVQYGKDEKLWSQMLGNVQKHVTSTPIMLTSGNHSYWSAYTSGTKNIEYNHTTINLPEQNTKNGQYYSFDYGNVHFTVLSSGDSEKTGMKKDQLKWLENDLASTDKKWKIVAIHNPLYSPGKYGSTTSRNAVARSLRKSLGKILCEYNVDLVLNGHDHVFFHTKPIDEKGNVVECKTVNENGNTFCLNPSAPIYMMSGAAGNQNRGFVDTYDPSIYAKAIPMADNVAGYSIINVTDEKLTSTYYEYDFAQNKALGSYTWGIIKK